MTPRTVAAAPVSSFASPLRYRGPLPLRVAVYGAVANAIRSGVLPPSTLLPPESEVAAAFDVSRTVMREALILLEEDGLIRTQRGVGRFVADVVPEIGIESLQPVEQMLSVPEDPVTVSRLRTEPEPATDFTKRWLGIAPDEASLMWESLVTRRGEAVALTQEWVAAPGRGAGFPDVPALLAGHDVGQLSMLAILLRSLGVSLGPSVCHISLTTAGADRAQALGVRPSSAVLLVTQAVSRDGTAFYLAKHLIKPEAGQLTVIQA